MPLTRYATKPTISAMTNILDIPAKAKIPRIDNTQSTRKTLAIALKGFGKAPMIPAMTKNIKRFQRVIGWPLMAKSVISGMLKIARWM